MGTFADLSVWMRIWLLREIEIHTYYPKFMSPVLDSQLYFCTGVLNLP